MAMLNSFDFTVLMASWRRTMVSCIHVACSLLMCLFAITFARM